MNECRFNINRIVNVEQYLLCCVPEEKTPEKHVRIVYFHVRTFRRGKNTKFTAASNATLNMRINSFITHINSSNLPEFNNSYSRGFKICS